MKDSAVKRKRSMDLIPQLEPDFGARVFAFPLPGVGSATH
jgi:hypothetical protein